MAMVAVSISAFVRTTTTLCDRRSLGLGAVCSTAFWFNYCVMHSISFASFLLAWYDSGQPLKEVSAPQPYHAHPWPERIALGASG